MVNTRSSPGRGKRVRSGTSSTSSKAAVRPGTSSKMAAKPGKSKKKASPQSAVDPPVVEERARYAVPGDDVEDEDLEFLPDNWPLSQRSRYLDPSLSERTRILAAVFARMQVPPSVGLSAWALSGLFSDDSPNVVLDRLPGNEQKQKRQSLRLLPAKTRQTIKDMADDSDISDDTFFIDTQPMIHTVVRYGVTESQANANAKAGAASRSSEAAVHPSGKRKSKTEYARKGTYSTPADYNALIAESQRQEDREASLLPWRCQVPVGKVVARRQPCGHKLKSERGCTKHALSMHNGLCHFINAVTKVERKEQINDAVRTAAVAAVAAVAVPAAAPAAPAAPAPAAVAAPAASRKQKCDVCKGFYSMGTYGEHIKRKRHRTALGVESLELDS